jgi:hypothetical protein
MSFEVLDSVTHAWFTSPTVGSHAYTGYCPAAAGGLSDAARTSMAITVVVMRRRVIAVLVVST